MSFHTFCRAEPTFPESQENWEKKGDLNEDGNNNFEDINKTLTDISGYFEEHASPTDGNCFYHSIVDYIEGNDNELTKTIFETKEYIDAYDTNSVNFKEVNFKEVYMFNMHWLRYLVWKESLKPLNNEQKGASEETIEFRKRLKEGVDQTTSDKNVYYDERGNVDRTKSYGHVGKDLWTMDREIDVTARLLGIDICTLQTIGEELKWVVSLHDPNNAKLDGLVCFLKNNGDHFTNLTYKGNTARMNQLRQKLRADRQRRTAAKTEEKGTPYLSEDLTNTSIKDLKKLIIDYNKKKSKGKRISGHSKLDQSGLVKKIVESGMMKKRPPPRSDKKQNSSNEQKESSNEQKNRKEAWSDFSDDFESMTQNKLKSWIQNYNSKKQAWQQITRYSSMDKKELKDRIRKQIVFDKDETIFDLDRLDPMTMVQLKSWWKYSLYGRTLFSPFFNFKQSKQWVIRYIKSNMSPRVLQDMLLSAFRNPGNQGIGLVKLLLTRKDIDVNQAMNNGETPLIITCEKGYVDNVRLLLARDDIDVNKANNDGTTPLVAACDHEDESKAELARRTQIQQEKLAMQDMEAVNRSAPFSLWQLLKKENTDFWRGEGGVLARGRLRKIIIKMSSMPKYHEKISVGEFYQFESMKYHEKISIGEFSQIFNEIKVDFDETSGTFSTPRAQKIHVATLKTQIRIENFHNGETGEPIIHMNNLKRALYTFLMKYTKTPEDRREKLKSIQRNREGLSLLGIDPFGPIDPIDPIDPVNPVNHVEVVRLLLDRDDIDVNQAMNNGITPLYIACARGNVDIVRLLLGRDDIDVNQAKEDGTTPLSIAQAKKFTEIVALFEVVNTPLVNASRKGKVDIVKRLLAREDIDVNQADGFKRTPLYHACKEGHVEIVKLLLARTDIQINLATEGGWTPLYIACNKGHVEVVKLLLTHKDIDVNQVDKDEETLLYVACNKGDVGVVEALLDKKDIDINKANGLGYTPLIMACDKDHVYIVQLLLARTEIQINQAANNGWTPLLAACQQNYVAIVRLLLDKEEIQINKAANDGRTPLYLACQNGHVDVVQLLLAQNEIQINQAEENGRTPLYAACINVHMGVVNLLLKRNEIQINQARDNGITPLYGACLQGHVDVVQLLLTRDDIAVNQAEDDGSTPLYVACQDGHVDIVRLLLAQNEIQINQAGDDGRTPLYAACWDGHVDVVQLLLTRDDIAVNQAGEDGATPLFIACQQGHVDVVRLLLARKEIQINQAKENGATPLYIVCHKGHVDVVQLLLARKEIQINQADAGGFTPLSIACHFGHVDVVRLLLARKDIDVNQAEEGGATPLYITCQEGHANVVRLLLDKPGIQINQARKDGFTPLYVACQNGHVDVVQLLFENKYFKTAELERGVHSATIYNHTRIVDKLNKILHEREQKRNQEILRKSREEDRNDRWRKSFHYKYRGNW